ncbi:MAG: polyprenyl synthetase family protein [Oscillospiraceae bacterium]|nr:polyprenyl synthetase family protein [Oscillospiraceae bacterium]
MNNTGGQSYAKGKVGLMDFTEKYAEYKKAVEDCLKLPELENALLSEPIFHSLNAGGKRVRPILCLSFCEAYGGELKKALPVAAALEMLHTSTLIQDDLPCMDDDDLRRGKPACHIAFSEAEAVLAASAMAYSAFRKIAEALPQSASRLIKEICAYMGVEGVYGGQKLDMRYEREAEDVDSEKVLQMYRMKTCTLLQACCVSGCIIAGADEKALKNAAEYAYNLGLAFQITDDILDEISSEAVLGKPVNSDARNKKTTYVSLVGLEKAGRDAEKYTKEALSLLENLSVSQSKKFLTELTKNLLSREN